MVPALLKNGHCFLKFTIKLVAKYNCVWHGEILWEKGSNNMHRLVHNNMNGVYKKVNAIGCYLRFNVNLIFLLEDRKRTPWRTAA